MHGRAMDDHYVSNELVRLFGHLSSIAKEMDTSNQSFSHDLPLSSNHHVKNAFEMIPHV